MWRVFWVPQDAVRAGVRRRVLAGWDDLPRREDAAGVQAGDPIFLSPDYRVDPLLGLYVQSATFRKYTAETKRNYATDIALLLTFLWGRGRAWTDAAERDLEDYEHWRRFAPDRIGGTKWDRELAAFASLYGWAADPGHQPLGSLAGRGRRGHGKLVNQAATLVAQSFGFEFSFLGPVVIVGVDKDMAEPAALSPAQAGAILEKIRAPSA
jgi:hypothetical protein